MVVGAYTIINTIGLLVGLPNNLVAETGEVSLNNTLPNYFIKENFTDTDLDKVYIIIDGSINNPVVDNTAIWLHYNFDFNGIYDINYHYKSKIDNYYIFSSYDNNQASGPEYYTHSYLTSNIVMDINQVYFARLTSDLSPINGDSIISSITSGLGLMGDITTNFKNGFSALIWDSTDNKLTTFGNFVLIFLGVSITFSIIKLCLNLIRSKTGA